MSEPATDDSFFDPASLDSESTELEVHECHVPGRGKIRFREMTRSEVHRFASVLEDKGTAEWERQVLATLTVEPTKFSHAQVKKWQDRPGSLVQIGELVEAINEKSGAQVNGRDLTDEFPA